MKVSESMFKFLAENDRWKELRDEYTERIDEAPDKSYPFMLFVNNPRTRSALKSSFLFKSVGKPWERVQY